MTPWILSIVTLGIGIALGVWLLRERAARHEAELEVKDNEKELAAWAHNWEAREKSIQIIIDSVKDKDAQIAELQNQRDQMIERVRACHTIDGAKAIIEDAFRRHL